MLMNTAAKIATTMMASRILYPASAVFRIRLPMSGVSAPPLAMSQHHVGVQGRPGDRPPARQGEGDVHPPQTRIHVYDRDPSPRPQGDCAPASRRQGDPDALLRRVQAPLDD